MLVVLLDWLCIKYYLTNLRLIEEKGIIGKRIMMVPLSKVQDIVCKFGILGRILGFGDLEIESAGTYGKIVFSFIANPRKRKEEINEALLKIKEKESNMKKKKAR
ncbi:MAG: PH domain-containing protein [candidate division WOR-3 bacterium]